MDLNTLTGPLEEFRRFVQSSEFHPDIRVADYGRDGHAPAMVLLFEGARPTFVLERLQILAANKASWKCFPEDFTYALYLSLGHCMSEHGSVAVLETIMGMPYASPVCLPMLLISELPDDESADDWAYGITPLFACNFWWKPYDSQRRLENVMQAMAVLKLTPFDFEPYLSSRSATTTMVRIFEAAARRWSPLRAAWVGAVGVTKYRVH